MNNNCNSQSVGDPEAFLLPTANALELRALMVEVRLWLDFTVSGEALDDFLNCAIQAPFFIQNYCEILQFDWLKLVT